MAESNPSQSSATAPEDFHLVFGYLRADIQGLRQETYAQIQDFRQEIRDDRREMKQEIREIYGRIDGTNKRIDDTNRRIDTRFALMITTMVATTGLLLAAIKL